MEKELSPASIRKSKVIEASPAIKVRGGYFLAKRTLDILASSALLVILSPLMLLIALAIFIYSPGPIFYIQDRVGSKRVRRGSRYIWERVDLRCYKFRTMKVNSDPSVHKEYVKALIKDDRKQMDKLQGHSTNTRKLLHDPRIIKPGRILRKLSLDELPQLWNVLRGDMSLVGPRPAIPYEVDLYNPWHLRRLNAQPGLTGLQQVEARCTGSFDEQVKFDLEYIERQSFWLDLWILLRTPVAVLSMKGAG